MAKDPTPSGKTRTRQHIIADLAVNHVERQVLFNNKSSERDATMSETRIRFGQLRELLLELGFR